MSDQSVDAYFMGGKLARERQKSGWFISELIEPTQLGFEVLEDEFEELTNEIVDEFVRGWNEVVYYG